jgi:nucleotide-binding universal stress UspA family protein
VRTSFVREIRRASRPGVARVAFDSARLVATLISMARMRWLVGFAPASSSVGVVRFAAWLHARSEGRHALHAIHIDSSAATGFDESMAAGPDLSPSERRAREFLAAQGVAEAFAHVESVHGSPEKVLQALASERDFDGLLLGRAAPVRASTIVSLGRVPRRVLRALELPTVIVPPDAFGPDGEAPPEPAAAEPGIASSAAPGPIVVGVTPSAESLEAAGFAVLLGGELGLPVVLAHVIPPARPVATAGVLSLEPRDPTMRGSDIAPPEDTSGPAAAMEAWAKQHGLDGLPLALRVGHVPVELVAFARERRATMIVCGSRRLSVIDRLFTSSVGSELAAHADRPVVVVPSDGRAQ